MLFVKSIFGTERGVFLSGFRQANESSACARFQCLPSEVPKHSRTTKSTTNTQERSHICYSRFRSSQGRPAFDLLVFIVFYDRIPLRASSD